MVLETEWESHFIREGQRGLSEVTSYWIGGSSYTEQIGNIEYSSYSASELGILFCLLKLNFHYK